MLILYYHTHERQSLWAETCAIINLCRHVVFQSKTSKPFLREESEHKVSNNVLTKFLVCFHGVSFECTCYCSLFYTVLPSILHLQLLDCVHSMPVRGENGMKKLLFRFLFTRCKYEIVRCRHFYRHETIPVSKRLEMKT